MIEKVAFQSGMHALGAAFNREISNEVLQVFDQVLSANLDYAQWGRAVRMAIENEHFFPPPAVLLKYGLDRRPTATEATEIFDKIVNDYFSGDHASPRIIGERYGIAARNAFAAAGGVLAFEKCGTEEAAKWARKAFIEAWRETVETNPAAALPGPSNQLPTGDSLEALRHLGAVTKKIP